MPLRRYIFKADQLKLLSFECFGRLVASVGFFSEIGREIGDRLQQSPVIMFVGPTGMSLLQPRNGEPTRRLPEIANCGFRLVSIDGSAADRRPGGPVVKLALLIVSWGWKILGVWWFFRPGGIRRRFEKRYRKGGRLLLLTVLAISAGILFAVGRRMGGVWGTVLAVLGVIAVLKALVFVRGRVSESVLDWWNRQPVWVYRVSAASLFLLGCLMQVVLRAG